MRDRAKITQWVLVAIVCGGIIGGCDRQTDARTGPVNKEDYPRGKIADGLYRTHILISPDGMRIAEIVHRGEVQFIPDTKNPRMLISEPGGVEYVALDGKEGNEYATINHVTMAFSPDSARFVYRAETAMDVDNAATPEEALNSSTQRYVLDGVEGKSYTRVGEFFFSPDGKRTAYTADRGDKTLVVIDGVEGKEYDHVSGLIFSSDGKRIAYEAKRGEKYLVVADGAEGKEYNFVGNVAFSPDDQRLTYTAHQGSERLIVRDGVESKAD